jgi:ArsR family transcriptional regulator, lead/cadmium/zinc/bismuth-responsive transcriptional repressor
MVDYEHMSNGSYVPGHAANAIAAELITPASVVRLTDTFKVLGDPTRVRILDALSKAELCVSDIAGLLGLTESAVSHQLRVLRHVRLVRARREGRQVFYALDDQHIISLFAQGLSHVEELAARRSDQGAA